MTAISVSRDVYNQVTDGTAWNVSTIRRVSNAIITRAMEKRVVTATFWLVRICNFHNVGSGKAMTVTIWVISQNFKKNGEPSTYQEDRLLH